MLVFTKYITYMLTLQKTIHDPITTDKTMEK